MGTRHLLNNGARIVPGLKTLGVMTGGALLLPATVGALKFIRNCNEDGADGKPLQAQTNRSEGIVQRSLTAERIGSWSDQKLEKMIKRNSVCKQNENYVRETYAKQKSEISRQGAVNVHFISS